MLSRINQLNTKKEARKSFLIYEWGGGGGVGVGAVSKKIFPPFEPQFGVKIKGGPPLDLPLIDVE